MSERDGKRQELDEASRELWETIVKLITEDELARIEDVVNAARDLDRAMTGDRPVPFMGHLHRALSLLDSQEEGTP